MSKAKPRFKDPVRELVDAIEDHGIQTAVYVRVGSIDYPYPPLALH